MKTLAAVDVGQIMCPYPTEVPTTVAKKKPSAAVRTSLKAPDNTKTVAPNDSIPKKSALQGYKEEEKEEEEEEKVREARTTSVEGVTEHHAPLQTAFLSFFFFKGASQSSSSPPHPRVMARPVSEF